MDISECEDQIDSDVDTECKKVSKRIENVTLESDSLPESPNNALEERLASRRKKRTMKRPIKGHNMDVDPSPKSRLDNKRMDCDDEESHISSSDESLSGDNQGGEADDEQSDWVGDTTPTGDKNADGVPFDRKMYLRKSASSHQVSNLQKKIDRFCRDGCRGELTIDICPRNKANNILLHRYLFKYQLEITHRHRSHVIIRKRSESTSAR
ncbi:unnamed protein product [Caenorhabditis bovis]|uniref:Uncharacterized protein n=1 Tax=Caenorhabditis bovis TaxID=2654633 RepID=A0A8S1EW65_9PELO|nr:unnamed protein product [Caenorhabditis bovis]